jgi:GNAT superfamily N-acetyltransferase
MPWPARRFEGLERADYSARSMDSAITMREQLRPGDLGEVVRLHGAVYSQEQGHGIAFEAYVAAGLAEFCHHYDERLDHLWLCEHEGSLVGMLFLMHRDHAAQLRYFLVLPEYRGRGLGKALMSRFMAALSACGYREAFLWTTNELPAAASLYCRHGFVLTEEVPSERFGKPLIEQKYVYQAHG